MEQNYQAVSALHEEYGYQWGKLETLFLGGGTPSLWGESGANYLKDAFKRWNISLDGAGEHTVEFNPGSLTEKTLEAFRETGFNRFSIGMQSLNPYFLKILDRIHSLDDCFNILKLMRDEQVNYSVDLMLGLPHSVEQKRDVIEELKRVLDYGPSHFSVYILTVGKNYPHQRPDEDMIADEYLAVADFLKTQGFEHYEVSNFALPEKESRHNLKYWNSETVAALGPSATGLLSEKRLRYKCKPDYQNLKLEELDEDEFRTEKVYMKLRTSQGLTINNVDNKKIDLWEQQSLLDFRDEKKIALNSKGYLLIDSIVSEII